MKFDIGSLYITKGAQEWLDYRQALRDIPSQEGFPDNIIYPEHP